jgi:hypothetical protein
LVNGIVLVNGIIILVNSIGGGRFVGIIIILVNGIELVNRIGGQLVNGIVLVN